MTNIKNKIEPKVRDQLINLEKKSYQSYVHKYFLDKDYDKTKKRLYLPKNRKRSPVESSNNYTTEYLQKMGIVPVQGEENLTAFFNNRRKTY